MTRRSDAPPHGEAEVTQQHDEDEDQGEDEDEDRHYHVEILENLSLWHLLRTEPWLFIPEGSLMGYFDWIPEQYRVGPWSRFASVVLGSFVYLWIMGSVYVYATSSGSVASKISIEDYPACGSLLWWYHTLGFFWLSFISASVYYGPAGGKAWATYSMWTWTLLNIRHGLCALAPWLSSATILEITRFPTLLMTTIVFCLWNFVVGPFIYFFGMTTPERKQLFLKYFTNFRLTQIHVAIIQFGMMNCVVASPVRSLRFTDFYYAMTVSLVYMLFYLLVLDRIGVHTYPLFTPRTDWCVVTYSSVLLVHVAIYLCWKPILSHGHWRQAILLWIEQTDQ